MKRLIVQQNDNFGWDVLDADDGAGPLYRGDRLRAEGFARRLCHTEGGTVTVTGLRGEPLSEYAVTPSDHVRRPEPAGDGASRGRRRRGWPSWGRPDQAQG